MDPTNIAVLCELRPHPDQANVIIHRAVDQLSLPSHDVVERRSARLYQHVDDPVWLLYLAEWDSREAFEAYRQRLPMPGTPDQFQELPSCRIARRLALFERVMTPVHTLYADTVDGPAEAHERRRDLALAYHHASTRSDHGPILLQIHESIESPPGLLILSGWEAPSPLQHAPAIHSQALLDQLRASSGTSRRFVGRSLVEASGN